MLGNMDEKDFRIFKKIAGKEISDKIVANNMPIQQLCKLDSAFIKVIFNLDDDGAKDLRDSLDWFLEKVFKEPSKSSQPKVINPGLPQIQTKMSQLVIVKKRPSLNGQDQQGESEKDLQQLVKGCGKIIPNDIPQGAKQCYSWFFADGKWRNWKTQSSIFWRYGCNWGGDGTPCGYMFPDGSNYCRDCGTKLEKLHRKFYV